MKVFDSVWNHNVRSIVGMEDTGGVGDVGGGSRQKTTQFFFFFTESTILFRLVKLPFHT